jgi:hypothetical protein
MALPLSFDNSVLRGLPLDETRDQNSRQVKGACFSLCSPEPLDNPRVASVSLEALELIGLSEEHVSNACCWPPAHAARRNLPTARISPSSSSPHAWKSAGSVLPQGPDPSSP